MAFADDLRSQLAVLDAFPIAEGIEEPADLCLGDDLHLWIGVCTHAR